MTDKKYFAIEQTNGTPTSVQEISADKYQQAVEKLPVDPKPEQPSKKIGIMGLTLVGYQLYGKITNYGSATKFNWSVSQGDAYKEGQFIHGFNDGRLKVSDGEFFVNLFEKQDLLKDGETYRLYINDYENQAETENYAEFIYKAPAIEDPEETREHSQPGKPDGSDKPVDPQPEPQVGEIRALTYDPSKGLEQIPVYTLANGAINILQSDVPFPVQAEFARKGLITHMHLNLDAMYGGPYNEKWNPKGLKYEQMGELMKAYNIPKHIGAYRMMYQNALDDIWPRKPRLANGQEDPNPFPNSQHELNERVAGYLMGIMQAVGWGDRPAILDLDFESGDFFTWGGVQAIAQAVKYSRKKFPNQRFLVYAGAHSNNAVEGGGSASRPELHVGPGPRFEAFRGAGVDITQGTVPYFRTPRQEWDNPPHYESVIGPGKPYASEKEYGLKSIIKTIGAKLDWTDGFLRTLPAGYKPSVFEWYMPVYEGGDNGEERRYYDNGEVWTSWNWLQVGEWIQESFPVWSGVTGTYRFGGGAHLWTDGRPWLPSNYALELGKVRLYSYNEFLNNPATQYNIQPEFSLDGGKTWVKDTPRTGTNPDAHLDQRGFIRAAYLKGKLWVVATAGQPFHNAGKSQQVLIRHNGKTFNRTLEPLTVHSFTVEI